MKRRIFLTAGIIAAASGAGALTLPRRWKYIVIHHSGGRYGDVDLLRRVHRERQPNDPVDMIPYHFLIGNGRGIQMGQIVETARWKNGIWGAHLSERNLARNMRGIGICLIGNYQVDQVPDAQLESCINLCRDLMSQYYIAADRVSLHGRLPKEQTLCPGKNFPSEQFFNAIETKQS